jgi:protein-S-isoprenylcysteine O-methyltransferase Ste14
MRIDTGPYRFTRNPIYFGMFLGLVGLAIAFDSLWLLVALVPFALVASTRQPGVAIPCFAQQIPC